MKAFLEYVAQALVDQPEAVQVVDRSKGNWVDFELLVAADDMGRLIGRGGKVANAIRALLRVAALRQGRNASLDIGRTRRD